MDESLLEAAAAWRLRRAAGLTAAEAEQLRAWLETPEHRKAYDLTARAWGAFEDADGSRLEALRAGARGRMRRRAARPWLGGAIAATLAVAVLAGGGYAVLRPAPAEIHATSAADAVRAVVLADGSRLVLDADTEVSTRFNGRERRLELRRGQARFEVAHDPSRPFRVQVGGSTVVALGTTFNIDRWGERTTVSLLEGAVEVLAAGGRAPARLAPGQQITIEGGRLLAVTTAGGAETSAWRDDRLAFEDVALGEALAQVNRYARTPVSVGEAALNDLRVSGVFVRGDAEAFAAGVARLYGLRATRQADRILLAAGG
jgi:transmembrane sensor